MSQYVIVRVLPSSLPRFTSSFPHPYSDSHPHSPSPTLIHTLTPAARVHGRGGDVLDPVLGPRVSNISNRQQTDTNEHKQGKHKVLDRHNLLHCSPRLKNTCVRRVVLQTSETAAVLDGVGHAGDYDDYYCQYGIINNRIIV